MPIKTHVWKGHEMPISYQRTDPEGMRLAESMRFHRQRLGETQEMHASRYKVSRATYIRWECFGPPKRAWLREFVRLTMRKMRGHSKGRPSHAKKAEKRAKNAVTQRAPEG